MLTRRGRAVTANTKGTPREDPRRHVHSVRHEVTRGYRAQLPDFASAWDCDYLTAARSLAVRLTSVQPCGLAHLAEHPDHHLRGEP
jgi:hypothetical protein